MWFILAHQELSSFQHLHPFKIWLLLTTDNKLCYWNTMFVCGAGMATYVQCTYMCWRIHAPAVDACVCSCVCIYTLCDSRNLKDIECTRLRAFLGNKRGFLWFVKAGCIRQGNLGGEGGGQGAGDGDIHVCSLYRFKKNNPTSLYG